jgi:hypothetical protein
MSTEKNPQEEISEVLNEFYNLKKKYERTYYEKYIKKILKSTNKSNKEKRLERAGLSKPECVNCGRNVGTIFSIIGDEVNDRRNFTVICGDVKDPCPLNIRFSYGNTFTYESQIEQLTKLLDKNKREIVWAKNNALFGYNTPSMINEIFKEVTEEIKETTNVTGFLIEKNILVNHNPAKKELLNKLQDELQKEYMVPYKEFMQKFIQEDNVDFCKEAVELYVNEIIPKLKEIQSLKYGVNVVEYDNDTNTFHLIQRPNTLDSLEYKTNDDQITSFVKGVAYKKSSKKTQKADDTTAKNKTMKRKPVIEIEVVEDKYDVWEKAKAKLETRGALQRLNDLLPNAEQEVADAKDIVQKMTEDEYIEPDVFEAAEETLRKKVEELNRIKDEIKVKTEEKLANEEEELRIQKERREGIQIEREDEASRNIQQARKAREDFEKLQEQEKEYAEKDKFRRYEVPNILEEIISNVFEGKR